MLKHIASACRNLFRRDSVERGLDEELLAAVDILTEEKIRAGETPSAARRNGAPEPFG